MFEHDAHAAFTTEEDVQRSARGMRRIAAGVLTLGLAVGMAHAVTGAGPSSPAAVFVPNDRVPLSEFLKKTSTTIVLHVDPLVLSWISAHSGTVQVCSRKNGVLQFVNATSTNATTGEVTLTNALVTGDCVVVTSLLKQDIVAGQASIVTNWDPSLNSGHGGQSVGAKGALSTLDLDAATAKLVVSGPALLNSNVNWPPPPTPPAADPGDYVWASDLYSLFSDGSGLFESGATARTPDYERYIAENYVMEGPTNLAAIWLSDEVRALTGFAIAHRNEPGAFNQQLPLGKHVEDDLPVFQIVHTHLVAPPVPVPDTSAPGKEESLASFILPPGWTSQAGSNTYPILFNGFYDLHGSTFNALGPAMMDVFGKLYRHAQGPRRAVGVIWNGGGADACYTMQRSAYDNAAQAIADAATLLKANPNKIVFSGNSRGGVTALEMASNPYGFPYTAKFVNASLPPLRMGASVSLASPSYRLGLASMTGVNGWQDSWKSDWREPGTNLTGAQVCMRNLFGTTDPSVIDDGRCPDSSNFVSALAASGAGVVLRVGTHDNLRPFAYVAEYVDRLRAAGVHVQFEIYYADGHAIDLAALPGDLELLNMIFDSGTLTTVVKHFARDANDPTSYHQITPSHIPLVFETPLSVGTSQTHTWSFVGQPGWHYQVRAKYFGFSDPNQPEVYVPQNPWPQVSEFSAIVSGTLSKDSEEALFGTSTQTFSWAASPGYWGYVVAYSPDANPANEIIVGRVNGLPTDFAPPTKYGGDTVVGVWSSEVLGAVDTANTTITGGVAEDRHFP